MGNILPPLPETLAQDEGSIPTNPHRRSIPERDDPDARSDDVRGDDVRGDDEDDDGFETPEEEKEENEREAEPFVDAATGESLGDATGSSVDGENGNLSL